MVKKWRFNYLLYPIIIIFISLMSYEWIQTYKYSNRLHEYKNLFENNKYLISHIEEDTEDFFKSQKTASLKKINFIQMAICIFLMKFLFVLSFLNKSLRKKVENFNEKYKLFRCSFQSFTSEDLDILLKYSIVNTFFNIFLEILFNMNRNDKINFLLLVLHIIFNILGQYVLLITLNAIIVKFGKKVFIFALIILVLLISPIHINFFKNTQIFEFRNIDIHLLDKKIQNLIVSMGMETNIYKEVNPGETSNAFTILGFTSCKIYLLGRRILENKYISGTIAHELGHIKIGLKYRFLDWFCSRLLKGIMYLFIYFHLTTKIKSEKTSKMIIFVILVMIYNNFFKYSFVFLSVLIQQLEEFKADSFAHSEGFGISLIRVLCMINSSNWPLYNSKIFSMFFMSHPTLFERIENIERTNS
ncbi:putative M48 peptidase [Hamiltosporidium tvaerminnensis]|uniref:Putative M48 peptidase n=1 Tax=Hamiltosporidium tvaerminnensis TaxID=1176355 RepID=A0A4Q9L415_9MICR|nr:putative M48 peptidase [Hamiltosporidium tvaerminnensis]